MVIGAFESILDDGWKTFSSAASNADMDLEYQTPQDLIPVIENVPGARRDFIEKFQRVVWYTSNKVGVKRGTTQEDVAMQLWVAVFDDNCRMLRKFSGVSKFTSYLCACLVNKAMSIGRKISCDAAKIAIVLEEEDGDLQILDVDSLGEKYIPHDLRREGADSSICRKQTLSHVKAAVNKLPPDKKHFFRQAFIEDRSSAELMQEFGLVSENAVYQWRSRVLSKVRESLGKDLVEGY
jgi:RNA polymerase sigma factor (sigma-70 family)